MININKTDKFNFNKIKFNKDLKKTKTNSDFFTILEENVVETNDVIEISFANNFYNNSNYFNEETNRQKTVLVTDNILKELELIKLDFLKGKKDIEKLSSMYKRLEELPLVFDFKIQNLAEELKTLISVEIEKIKKVIK